MTKIIKQFILPLVLLSAITISPAFSDCAIEGAVCGDQPTWDPCCNPDRYHCELENPDAPEGERYGICSNNPDSYDE